MILQSKIIIIAIVGMIVVVTAGTVAYRYSEQWQIVDGVSISNVEKVVVVDAPAEDQKAAVSFTKPESTPTETVPAPKTAMSPKETFMKMMAEFNKMKTYTDYQAFVVKNGSKMMIASMEADQAYYNANPKEGEQANADIEGMSLLVKEITAIQESVNGSTATLNVSFKSGLKVIVILVSENHQWKLGSDDWHPVSFDP